MNDDRATAPSGPPMPNLLMYIPDQWDQVERFRHFHSGTYKFDARQQRTLSGLEGHFKKANQFHEWCKQLAPALEIDEKELLDYGFTPAIHSQRLSAIVEATVSDLYATIDCTVRVLYAIYGKSQGFKKDTTTALYWHVDNIKGPFPEELKVLFRNISWYEMLRKMRSEITHFSIGNCHLDRATRKINYFIQGVLPQDKPPYIEDIFSWLEETKAAIHAHLEAIFGYLNSTLNDTPIDTMCGMTGGRMLMRKVIPTQPIDFNNGVCIAWLWFERPGEPPCPFVAVCGAYKRAKGIDQAAEAPPASNSC